jgi:hypothetical protein
MNPPTKLPYLQVKIAGGATAQCLGLMNAIFASNKLAIPFKVSYYPYSTGSYWPFAISELLDKNEILDLSTPTKGLTVNANLEVGKTITNHPLMSNKVSYENALSFIRKIKLYKVLQFCRRELAILHSPKRLLKITRYYRSISGGFAQINDKKVNLEMNRRFTKAKKDSPFLKRKCQKNLVIIHYRLGDRKATGFYHRDFNSDLIIDPASFAEAMSMIRDSNNSDIYVVSDEPKLAQKLLATVNIKAKVKSRSGNIWEDIIFMSQASIFLGSNSQVSQLVNILVENNGGRSYMLNLSKKTNSEDFKNTLYFKSKFIKLGNNVYSESFDLEKNAHSAYKKHDEKPRK